MRDQKIVSLAEAYASIYEQEEITSEIESAAEYFCYLGLNEEGVRIVNEELGDEEFLNFISDINENLNTEELYFNEARRGGVKIEPKTAKGKEIKGKPTAASLKRLRAKKEERRRSEESSSESKPSGMKASLARQSAAVETAKKNQPKHRPVLDTVARGVMGLVSSAQKRAKKDVERRKEFMSAARETGKTIRKASGHLGGVAKEVGKGMSGTAKLAGHLVTKGLKERFENWLDELVEEGYDLSEYTLNEMFDFYLSEDTNLFDCIVEYLISEGYADDEEFAIEIMANMDEELIESIVHTYIDESLDPNATQRMQRDMMNKNLSWSSRESRKQADANKPQGFLGKVGRFFSNAPLQRLSGPEQKFARTDYGNVRMNQQRNQVSQQRVKELERKVRTPVGL